MNKRIFTGGLTVVFLLALMAVHVHGAALTDAQVRGFVSSFQEMHSLFDQYDDELDALFDDDDDGDYTFRKPISGMLDEMKGHEIYGKLQRLVRQHGFSNLDQWGNIGDRVFLAYLAIGMDAESRNIEQEMAAAFREIENNPHMSDEMKEEMKQIAATAMESFAVLGDVPERDKAAVRPYMAELGEALQYHDDDEWDDWDD